VDTSGVDELKRLFELAEAYGGVWGLGFKVYGLGYRDLGFRV
jgi:hypothetical protein